MFRERYFKWLLFLLPGSFWEEHERELLRVWHDEMSDAALEERRSVWIDALKDTLRTAPREHVDIWCRNLKFALTSLRRTPGFTLTALLTLALGSGATIAVFTLLNGVLLRPLPWAQPDRIGIVWPVQPSGERTWLSFPELEELQRDVASLGSVAGVGGLLGVLLAYVAITPIRTLGRSSIPRVADVALDGTVVAFALLVTVLTGVLFSVAPAWHAARGAVGGLLKEGARGSSARGHRVRGVLLVGKVALSIVLLVGAVLLLRSFARLSGVDPGFRPENVLAVSVGLPASSCACNYNDELASTSLGGHFFSFETASVSDRPLAKCRGLLGDEAAGVSDEDLDRVRRHAAAMLMCYSLHSLRTVQRLAESYGRRFRIDPGG